MVSDCWFILIIDKLYYIHFFSSFYFLLYIVIGKEKLDGVKRPKTGGGPPLPPLTQGEETFLRLADGEPHLSGLQGGIDTDGDLQFDYYLKV